MMVASRDVQLLAAPVANDGSTAALTAEESATSTKREPLWDNLKGICVLCVVLIHTLSLLGREAISAEFISGLMLVLVFVVMPGFSFASGHLSSASLNRRQLVNLLRMWVVFFIQQGLFAAVMALGKMHSSSGHAFLPFSFWGLTGVTWFLFCLAVWRTILPLLAILRWPVMSTLLISLLAQLTDSGSNVYAQTMFCFLPFFMVGYQCTPEMLQRWRRPLVQAAFCFVILLAGGGSVVLQWMPGTMNLFHSIITPVFNAYGCLYGGDVAANMQKEKGHYSCASWIGPAGSLAFFVLAIPLICGFLACIPRHQIWGLTRAGVMSIYIYLLHIYVLLLGVMVLKPGKNMEDASQSGLVHGPIGILGCIVFAVANWAFLGCGWTRFVCCWCVEPRVERFLVQSEKLENSMPTAV